MSSNDTGTYVDDEFKNVFEYVKKIYIPTTVVSLGEGSLTCVTAFGTKIKYNGTPNIKYIQSYAFGNDTIPVTSGYILGEKYMEIPDSVEILGIENSMYFCNYYSLGKNINTLIQYDGATIGYPMTPSGYADNYNPINIAFFRGTINDLNNTTAFTKNDVFQTGNYGNNIIYCLDDNKVAIQEVKGDKFTWKETDTAKIKTSIMEEYYIENGDEAQDYVNTILNIIEQAKRTF